MSGHNKMRLICLLACIAVCTAASYSQRQAAEVVSAPQTGEAHAAALGSAASAAAAAAKLDSANWAALDQYGWEQGNVLLARDLGVAAPLYAAALPPRSFVAEIDPAFQRGRSTGAGQQTAILRTGSRLAAAAI